MTKNYSANRLRYNYNLSLAKITDFFIVVILVTVVSFALTMRYSQNMLLSTMMGILFCVLSILFMQSLYLNIGKRKGSRVDILAHKLYLQSHIINIYEQDFDNLMVELLKSDGYTYLPEKGSGYRIVKDKKFYFLYPLRCYNSYKLSGQDILKVLDIARKRRYKRILITASCKIDEVVLEFIRSLEDVEITIFDMDDITNLYIKAGHNIPDDSRNAYLKKARLEAGKRPRASLVKTIPTIKYLLFGIMLLVASIFMPFKTLYLIGAGFSLSLFVILLIYPRIKRHRA